MEVDAYDKCALPIVAKEWSFPFSRIVGTARLILNEEFYYQLVKAKSIVPGLPERVKARLDQPLSSEINRPLPFPLPIFASQPLSPAAYYRKHLRYAELSRVIVDEEHRGQGLADQLINFALEEARKLSTDQLFLECIPAHQSLYGKHGFQIIPGPRSEVDHVYKRMIGMARPYPPLHETELS